MNKTFAALNLILALLVVAAVILYASVIIPIALASLAAFCLALWLYGHLVDFAFHLGSKIKRWYYFRNE